MCGVRLRVTSARQVGNEGRWGAVPGDFGVEGFDADMQAAGFGFARAVVIGWGETGQAGENLLIAERIVGFMDWATLLDWWITGFVDGGGWRGGIGGLMDWAELRD